MLSPETLAAFALASAILSVAPGPDNLFVLVHSAVHGGRSGVIITLGLCTGLLVHTTAVALGLAAILLTSAVAFTLLKTAGALYLLYLAWQAFRASGDAPAVPAQSPLSRAALYRRGVIMNLTNPKVSLFFLAFLPQFVVPEAGSVQLQIALLQPAARRVERHRLARRLVPFARDLRFAQHHVRNAARTHLLLELRVRKLFPLTRPRQRLHRNESQETYEHPDPEAGPPKRLLRSLASLAHAADSQLM